MDKYKIVGIIDLILGILQMLSVFLTSAIINSYINSMSNTGLVSKVSTYQNSLLYVIVVASGVSSIWIAGYLLTSKSQSIKKKLFKPGFILSILSILILSFYTATTVASIISPIQNFYSH